MQRVMGTFAPTRPGTRLRLAASKKGTQSVPVAEPRQGVLARFGLEREDFFAIPLCAMWAAGVMRMAVQVFAVMQSVQPAAMELALRGGDSPWTAALRLPMVIVRNWFGW